MIYIFLPAYNEEIALPRLLKKFDAVLKQEKEPYLAVVLDDGSRDKTSEVAQELGKQYPVHLIRHEVNKGLGVTMRDGIEYITKVSQDSDWVVTLDCDDTHEPRFVVEALKKIREGHDVVILSRFCPGGGEEGLSMVKSFLSRGAGMFLGFFFPIRGVKEYSCGYRVFRASILKKALKVFGDDFIRLSAMGFAVTPEILIKMRILKADIAESPFVLRYDQKPTKSSNNAMKTIQGYFAIVWNYWGRG